MYTVFEYILLILVTLPFLGLLEYFLVKKVAGSNIYLKLWKGFWFPIGLIVNLACVFGPVFFLLMVREVLWPGERIREGDPYIFPLIVAHFVFFFYFGVKTGVLKKIKEKRERSF